MAKSFQAPPLRAPNVERSDRHALLRSLRLNCGGIYNSYPRDWGTTTDGGTSNWDSGVTARFTSGSYTFSGFGNGAAIGDVILDDNVSVAFTGSSGSVSGGYIVRTFTIGQGSVLNFGTQSLGAAAMTNIGIIKEGAGVLAMRGSGYTLGFTLNAGTVVATASTAFGAVTLKPIAFNGGVVASNDSYSFGHGVNVGGNIQIGELSSKVSLASSTAYMRFSFVDLGDESRTITIGNNAQHRLINVSGEEGVGLTVDIAPGATGALELTNVTYSGPTRVEAGAKVVALSATTFQNTALDLSANGTFLLEASVAPNFTIGGLINDSGDECVLTASGITLSATAQSSIAIPEPDSFVEGAVFDIVADTFTLDGNLAVNLGGTYRQGTYNYDLYDGNTDGAFTALALSGTYSAILNSANDWSATDEAGNSFTFDSASGVLTIVAAPEPAEFAVVLALSASCSWPEFGGAAAGRGERACNTEIVSQGGLARMIWPWSLY